MIIGGDFNFESGSPEYKDLERLGFIDTREIAMPEDLLDSYNPQKNSWPFMKRRRCRQPLSKPLPSPDDQDTVIHSYREAISMPRRIDFLFSMAFKGLYDAKSLR